MSTRRNSVDIGAMSPYMQRVLREKLAGESVDAKLERLKSRIQPQAEMPGMETSEAMTMVMDVQRKAEAKKAKRDTSESAVDRFDREARQFQLPAFTRELMFAKDALDRRWKFDFAFMEFMLAVEIEGLVVQRVPIAQLDDHKRVKGYEWELICRGRHASINGFKEDCVKYAAAVELGWHVLRFEQSQVKDGTAIQTTQRVLYAKGWRPAAHD